MSLSYESTFHPYQKSIVIYARNIFDSSAFAHFLSRCFWRVMSLLYCYTVVRSAPVFFILRSLQGGSVSSRPTAYRLRPAFLHYLEARRMPRGTLTHAHAHTHAHQLCMTLRTGPSRFRMPVIARVKDLQ